MSKQTKYTKAARGEECQIRIPFVCNGNNETSVLCHMNGAGMGIKELDIEAAIGCSACHDAVDGKIKVHSHTRQDIELMFYEGCRRTRRLFVATGLLKL